MKTFIRLFISIHFIVSIISNTERVLNFQRRSLAEALKLVNDC